MTRMQVHNWRCYIFCDSVLWNQPKKVFRNINNEPGYFSYKISYALVRFFYIFNFKKLINYHWIDCNSILSSLIQTVARKNRLFGFSFESLFWASPALLKNELAPTSFYFDCYVTHIYILRVHTIHVSWIMNETNENKTITTQNKRAITDMKISKSK